MNHAQIKELIDAGAAMAVVLASISITFYFFKEVIFMLRRFFEAHAEAARRTSETLIKHDTEACQRAELNRQAFSDMFSLQNKIHFRVLQQAEQMSDATATLHENAKELSNITRRLSDAVKNMKCVRDKNS